MFFRRASRKNARNRGLSVDRICVVFDVAVATLTRCNNDHLKRPSRDQVVVSHAGLISGELVSETGHGFTVR